MTKKNKFVKFTIIFILVFFVAVTGLSMIVPYIGGNKNIIGTGDAISWAIVESGMDVAVDATGTQLPALTKEEASAKLQELLSGIKK